jgi:hypothetical protein
MTVGGQLYLTLHRHQGCRQREAKAPLLLTLFRISDRWSFMLTRNIVFPQSLLKRFKKATAPHNVTNQNTLLEVCVCVYIYIYHTHTHTHTNECVQRRNNHYLQGMGLVMPWYHSKACHFSAGSQLVVQWETSRSVDLLYNQYWVTASPSSSLRWE